MPTLRSVSGGPDIPVDSPVVLVGRHPQCDARLDSHWVSLRHCIPAATAARSRCGTWAAPMGPGSTAGGSRRLRPGDEISIAHIRYRLEGEPACRACVATLPSE
jgi:hypothetical protein